MKVDRNGVFFRFKILFHEDLDCSTEKCIDT